MFGHVRMYRVLVGVACLLLFVVGFQLTALAQDNDDPTPEAPEAEVTEAVEPSSTLTPTATVTESATPTITPSYTPTATFTYTPSPTSTPQFPGFTTRLTIDPQTTSGNFAPGDEITFTVRVINLGGGTLINRTLRVSLVYDAGVFRAPSEDNISANGVADSGSITWVIDGIGEGEDNGLVFTFKTTLRTDLKESSEAKASATVRTSFDLELASSDVVTIPIVVEDGQIVAAGSSVQVPQGEGLFKSEGSFALLIGVFFGIGGLIIAALAALVIFPIKEADAREHTFRGTTEVLLLLIVLFSVIVMGVQNAIDRESINAIIGGIVGYVAGRVSSRVSLPPEVTELIRSNREKQEPPPTPPDTEDGEKAPETKPADTTKPADSDIKPKG